MAQGALTIRFFGGAREVVGARQLRLELSLPTNETKLRAALAERWPELGPHLGHCRLARNDAFVTADERFAAGDTVDVLPPVAGGSTRVHAASIVERAITLEPLVDAVSRHEAGAVASFLGIVRNHHQGDA
ncbi:MAG: MoaD/ThiS family protein, partial [Myxococcota bacterium]